jgi:CheY-like chemotaxis protein
MSDEKTSNLLNSEVRIFLVEDNADHVFIALTVIRQVLGDAIDMIHARPDLFLVDLRLPDNGGFSVLQAMRNNPALETVPVFVITSSLFDRDIAKSYELGASAVLCKPLSRASFKDELVRIGALPLSARGETKTFRH